MQRRGESTTRNESDKWMCMTLFCVVNFKWKPSIERRNLVNHLFKTYTQWLALIWSIIILLLNYINCFYISTNVLVNHHFNTYMQWLTLIWLIMIISSLLYQLFEHSLCCICAPFLLWAFLPLETFLLWAFGDTMSNYGYLR